MILGAALAFLLGVEPAAAAGPLDPPPSSDAVRMSRLVSCTTLAAGTTSSSVTQLVRDAAQLGWTGTKRYALQVVGTGDYAEAVPTIPCINSGTHLGFYWVLHRLTGTSATSTAIGSANIVVTCATLAGVRSTQTVVPAAANISPPNSTAGLYTVSSQIMSGITTTNCPTIVSIAATVYSAFNGGGTVQGTATWLPRVWNTDEGGWVPATSANDFGGDGIELPILCVVNTTGADIFAITQNFWASLAAWVPCLLIPAGWDRADRIATVWNTGNVAALSGAFDAAIPGGIACGEVFNVTTTMMGNITFSTCAMDVAPSWVKQIVSGVMVLGIAALAIRRIMWAVGSKG